MGLYRIRLFLKRMQSNEHIDGEIYRLVIGFSLCALFVAIGVYSQELEGLVKVFLLAVVLVCYLTAIHWISLRDKKYQLLFAFTGTVILKRLHNQHTCVIVSDEWKSTGCSREKVISYFHLFKGVTATAEGEEIRVTKQAVTASAGCE